MLGSDMFTLHRNSSMVEHGRQAWASSGAALARVLSYMPSLICTTLYGRYYHHCLTEEEAGSKRLKNLPKNTNMVKDGASSQIEVSLIRNKFWK